MIFYSKNNSKDLAITVKCIEEVKTIKDVEITDGKVDIQP